MVSYIKQPLGDRSAVRRLARGAFWSLSGVLTEQGFGLLASVVMARLLGLLNYGALSIIQATLGVFALVAGPSLGLTATKYVAELRARDPERAGRVIGLSSLVGLSTGVFLSLLLWVAAPYVSSQMLQAPHLSEGLRLACFVVLVSPLIGALVGGLAGLEAFQMIAQVHLSRGLLNLPIIIGATWFAGLQGAVGALSTTAIVGAVIAHLALRKSAHQNNLSIHYQRSVAEWRLLFSFTLPALLSAIVVVLATWTAQMILVRQHNGFAEMALFEAANRWRLAILLLPSIMNQPTVPVLAESYGQNSLQSFVRVVRIQVAMALTGTLLVLPAVVLSSGWLMSAYGSEFGRGWHVLALLAATTPLYAATVPIGSAIWSMGRMWDSFGLNSIWAVALVLVFSNMVVRDAWGLAVAYLIAYTLHFVNVAIYGVVVVRLIGERSRTDGVF